MTKPQAASPTAIGRLAEARRNEDLVLAESSLVGERRIAWVRLAMAAIFGLSLEVIAPALGRTGPIDLVRNLVGSFYGLLALVNLIIIHRRRRPRVMAALVYPFIASTVDVALLTFMGLRNLQVTGASGAEMGAIAFALVLSFSVARAAWIHVAWSTGLVCAGFLVVAARAGLLTSPATVFVVGGFLAFGLLIGLTNSSVRRMFTGLRRRDNLSRFLPRAVVERILEGGESALAPVQCEVTVLFSDIRDFTSFSEALAPREVLEFLDEYFGYMTQAVKGRDGVVNKFLGDGMLAFWGAPERNAAHAELALRAALDMRASLAELNETRARAGLPVVRFGVGVHTGVVAAGMLGGADQHEYTVIGDAVNVASRIEGLTKSLGTDILVSESTWRLADGGFTGRRCAEENVKGRVDKVVVYSLDGTI